MGLFSTKKKVYVSSTVYKVIDDGSERKSYMREIVAVSALSDNQDISLGEAITKAHIEGPRKTQRSFFRWAKNHYDFGIPRAAINYNEVIDAAVLAATIKTQVFTDNPAVSIVVNESFIDNADESYYAERFINENRKELALLDWAADVDPDTNEIWIQYPPGTTYLGSPLISESFSEPGFNSSDTVLVAYYAATTSGVEEPVRTFIYKIGDGVVALDSYTVELDDGASAREFYPPIPLRINNKSVFEAGSPAVGKEQEIRDAYKKALSTDIQDTLDEIESNPQIGDIDYAYMVFGVSLNTKSKYEQLYLFEFFRSLAGRQTTTAADYTNFEASNDALGYHLREINNAALLNIRAANDLTNPGFLTGVSSPDQSRAPQITNIHLTLPTPELGVLDMKISWSDIQERRVTGVIYQGAKIGDVEVKESATFNQTTNLNYFSGEFGTTSTVSGIMIRKQINSLEYIEVECKGLQHKNLIYKGKSVDITAEEALNDPDDSGFVIPLHEPTMRKLGVVVATELARESYLLVFNSYQVVKTKWYQKGIFRALLAIIIVIIVVVAAYYLGPEVAGVLAEGGVGLLGTGAAVGAALGFTGVVAVAVGAAANAIAAMIVLSIISKGATALFGAKIGAIITTLAAIAMVLTAGPNGLEFSNAAANLANMASIDKLLMLTSTITDIVSIFQQAALSDILEATAALAEGYESQEKALETAWEALGFGEGLIDPTMMIDYSNPLDKTHLMGEVYTVSATFRESPDDFMSRTLMTGSDLIEMSQAMVSEFVKATLTLV